MTEPKHSSDTLLFPYWEPIVVRWGDMDAIGHVNHAKYFTYFECARMNYFIKLALEKFSKKKRFGPVVANAACNYRRQVHHPATLLVGTRVGEIRNRSFVMEYVVLKNQHDFTEIVADGSTVVVWIETASGNAVPIPPSLRNAIKNLENKRMAPSINP